MALVTVLSVACEKLGSATFQVAEAGDAEGDSRKQAGADQPADLAPRESLDAVPRIGQRERC